MREDDDRRRVERFSLPPARHQPLIGGAGQRALQAPGLTRQRKHSRKAVFQTRKTAATQWKGIVLDKKRSECAAGRHNSTVERHCFRQERQRMRSRKA